VIIYNPISTKKKRRKNTLSIIFEIIIIAGTSNFTLHDIDDVFFLNNTPILTMKKVIENFTLF
jgi:hypothetical protein